MPPARLLTGAPRGVTFLLTSFRLSSQLRVFVSIISNLFVDDLLFIYLHLNCGFSKNIRNRFIYTAIPETLFPLVSAEITDYDLNRAIQNGTIPSFLACLFSKESRDEIKSIEWDSDTILGFVCLFALGGLAILFSFLLYQGSCCSHTRLPQ